MTLAEAMLYASDGEPFTAAIGRFLDQFFDADPDARQAMIDDALPPLDDVHVNLLSAAVAAHLALMWGLEVPDWAREPSSVLAGENVPATLGPPTPGSDLHWVPPAFARRGFVNRGEPLLGDRQPPELYGFLLTPVGTPPRHPDLRLHARRGAYSEGADPAYASIVVTTPPSIGIAREYALVSLGSPVPKLLGIPLSYDAVIAVAEFAERHRAALLDHWTGATDSLDLLDAIHDRKQRSQ